MRDAAAAHETAKATAEGRGEDGGGIACNRGLGARVGHADAIIKVRHGEGGAGQQDGTGPLAMLAIIVGDQRHRPHVGRFDQQRGADGFALVVIIAVRDIAVAVDDLASDAQGDGVADRHVERQKALLAVVIAIFEQAFGTEFAQFRLFRQHVDGAAGGVAAIKRALRSLDHFDALQIVEDAGRGRRAADIDAVEVEGDGVFGKAVLRTGADAAQEEAGGAAGRLDDQRGDQLAEIGGFGDARLGEIVTGHGRYGKRGALQRLRAALGSDDDVGEAVIGGFGAVLHGDIGLLGRGALCDAESQDGGGSSQKQCFHDILPCGASYRAAPSH